MAMDNQLKALEDVIRERRNASVDESYVARLRHKGRAKMAEKLGEEAIEAVIAAVKDDSENMTAEAADILFHLMLLLVDMDLSIADVIEELQRREGVSGLVEKAGRDAK